MGFVTADTSYPALVSAVSNYSPIIIVISPPRCSSTAFARVFWQHPAIRYYAHEPFETTYYINDDLSQVISKLQQPLDLAVINEDASYKRRSGLIIKEMPYQVGDQLPLLLSISTNPIIFLMRNPRLNIASRMAKKIEVGDTPFFPHIESGWELLKKQIAYCCRQNLPYMIVDAAEFRSHPQAAFAQVFGRLGLAFSPEMLTWESRGDIELDNLGGEHRHLYRHALTSTGIEPEAEQIRPLESFPIEHGWQDHVAHCLAIYEQIRCDPQRIVI